MSQQIEFINQSLLRCHLAALISMAGAKLPPGFKQHPDETKLGPSELIRSVETYRSFLRTARSFP